MNSLIMSDMMIQHFSLQTSSPVIELESVNVKYRVYQERVASFKEYAIRQLRCENSFTDFFALQNVTLKVERGEIFGIIGSNGAGKSTLLKVVSRVLAPTQGRVIIRGEVSPLLELGAGFHPELTGNENIFLNGTLLGHSHREIEKRYDEILAFAELGNFINAPLRTYSSGMVARLGFAVATAWEAEILILDEILAVGDGKFRKKCQSRMLEYCSNGTTIMIVTHDMDAVRSLCTRVAWLEQGNIRQIGAVDAVVDEYKGASS